MSLLHSLSLIQIILGVILLFTGRRLFWIFIGIAGFVAGVTLAPMIFPNASNLILIVTAIVTGVIGLVLALFLQKLAIGIAGFIAGGYGLTTLLTVLRLGAILPDWLTFLIGGILGAILVAVIFDWALIILSSVTGASMVIKSLSLLSWLGILLWIVLVAVGIGVQARDFRKRAGNPH